MFEFFSIITGFFQTVWDVVLNVVNSLLVFLASLSLASTFSNLILLYFPSIISASVIAVVAVAVVKLIIGR